MIFSGTYSTFTCSALMSTSGLVGTIGIRVIDPTGAVIVARRTTGITEPVAGSGFYVATIDLTALAVTPGSGHYYVFWDDGSATPGHVETEDLMLHQTTTMSQALQVLSKGMTGHNAENVSVGLFIA